MSTEVMPMWMVGFLTALTAVAAWLVRLAWRIGKAERAKLGAQPAPQYWWPKSTLERGARLYGMIIMLLTAGAVAIGWTWAVWVGAAFLTISWALNVLADYTDEHNAAVRAALRERS